MIKRETSFGWPILEFWNKHLVYVPGLTNADILRDHNKSISISEVDFLINNKGSSIELATAFMYTQDKCGENQMQTINRFLLKNMEWEGENSTPTSVGMFTTAHSKFIIWKS